VPEPAPEPGPPPLPGPEPPSCDDETPPPSEPLWEFEPLDEASLEEQEHAITVKARGHALFMSARLRNGRTDGFRAKSRTNLGIAPIDDRQDHGRR
jgi:hypothetical protein